MRKYIFSGGDSDGVMGASVVLNQNPDALVSFISPAKLATTIRKLVSRQPGKVYIVDIALASHVYHEVYSEVIALPNVEFRYFDQHHLPLGLKVDNLPFTYASIDEAVSSCENVYRGIGSSMDPIFPAIASINDGIEDSEMIRVAREKHGGKKLYRNAEIVKFGIAYNVRSLRFRLDLANWFANGQIPDTIPKLVNRARYGKQRWEEIKKTVDERVQLKNNIAYGFFPFFGGYANMVAAYLVETYDKAVGISILEPDHSSPTRKMNMICEHPNVNIGRLAHDIAVTVKGRGAGSETSAGASMYKERVDAFLDRLDKRVGELIG